MLGPDHREVSPRGRVETCESSMLPRMEEAASSGPSQMLGSHWVHSRPRVPSLRGRQAFVMWHSHSERLSAHVPLPGVGRGQPRLESSSEAETQTLCVTFRETTVVLLPGKHIGHTRHLCAPFQGELASAEPPLPMLPALCRGPLLLPDRTSVGHPSRGQTCLCGDSDL